MQHFLSCRASFIHFLNYILYYAWVCFLTLAQTKIAALFRRLTGSCQTLKTEQRCQRQFPRERHTALVLLFKNTKDGVFLPGKCRRRCPLLLLHTVAASSKTFKRKYTAVLQNGQRAILIFIFIWTEHSLQKMFSQTTLWGEKNKELSKYL